VVVANDDFTPLGDPSNEVDLEELDDSQEAFKRRGAEQARREAIHRSFQRMSLFRVPGPGYFWS